MKVFFYRRVEGQEVAGLLPIDTVMRTWRPAEDGLPPRGPKWLENLVWWLFDGAEFFARRGFTEITIWWEGRVIHRLLITPRWWRFPFMAKDELQIGGLWTDPELRGRGLARVAIADAHQRFAETFWYAAPADNAASIHLIESCCYRLVGVGRRTRPLGIAALGRYVIDGPAD